MKAFLKSILLVSLIISVPLFFISCGEEEPPPPSVTVDADAGTDQTVNVGATVNLDGSGSSSSDGSTLAFVWVFSTQPSGSAATLTGPATATPSFTPDVAGDYILTLTVTSGSAVDTDQVTITAQGDGSNNDPSVVVNGEDSVKWYVGGDLDVELTVADADGDDLTLTWEVVETIPPGGTATFQQDFLEPEKFIIRANEPGYFNVKVTADDGKGGMDTDSLQMFIGNVLESNVSADLTMENYFEDEECPDWYLLTNSTINADVTAEAGVYLEASEDVGITIAASGSLNAVGTAENGIFFTSDEATRGHWKGLEFLSNSTSNELTHVVVAYGGSSGFDGANLLSNVMVDDAGRLKVTNSIISNSAGYGIYTRTLEATLVDFADNLITSNAAPVMTRIHHYHYFDEGSSYTGNDDDYIDSYWSNQPNETGAVTWKSLDVPYRLADNIERLSITITIEPGADFLGQPGTGLDIQGSGSLNAVGTMNEKITFKGEQDVRGYWTGLNFDTNNTANELTYVEIANGGSDGFDGANLKSNIMVEEAGRLKITNTLSTKSDGYGLYTRALESTLVDFENNTLTDNVAPVMTRAHHYHYFDGASDYTGNDNDYIDSYWSNQRNETGTVTWQALNVPYRIANNIEELGLNITIEAGADFLGQQESGLEISGAGSLTAVGTSNERITFAGEQDVEGFWKGIQIRSNNLDNVFDFISISNGGSEGFDGGNRKANIEIWDQGRLEVSNSLINKSGDAGIREEATATFINGGGNSFSGNLGNDLDLDI